MSKVIAVNTRLLLKDKLEGIGWFSYETLRRVVKNHPEHQFVFLFDRAYDKRFIFENNVEGKVIGIPARHPALFYLWFEHAVPKSLKSIKPDLFLSPDGYLSLKVNSPQLAVIHDLNFEYYPQHLPFLVRKYYKHYFPKFAQKAERIATVSEASKKDLINLYNIPESNIDVVYNGSSEWFSPLSEEEKLAIKNRISQNEDYFIYVGSLHPRKNLSNILRAFNEFKIRTESKMKFVIVGEKYYWTREMEEAYNKLLFKSDVLFVGRQYEENLSKLVGSSSGMIYASTFEGFGIPIVEAMNCDVPVITSNISCMPEIAGDAALLVDPFSVESICNAMTELHKNPDLAQKLIERGRIQRQKYSWDKTADLLWQSIEKALYS